MLGKLSDVLVLPNKPDRIAKKYLSLFDMQVLFPLPQTVLSKKKEYFFMFSYKLRCYFRLKLQKIIIFQMLGFLAI